jgi:cobyrinic acid a,c-diamide synthase
VIGFMLAGTASGVGKTTVSVGLMAAVRRRGLNVQPFKVGPDYIDTSYHARAAGVPSRNLDVWLLPVPVMRGLFARSVRQADVAVVEGVMGLFDGRLGGEGFASSAHVARELGLPVILVIDAAKLSWSAGALVLGYRIFDPRVKITGVILNRVGGPRHLQELTTSIQQHAGVPVLGWLSSDPALEVPERYLGLIPTTEGSTAEGYFRAAEAAVARSVDLDRLLNLAHIQLPGETVEVFPTQPVAPRAAIAVAQDRAFSFYYQDSLDLLAAWGAEIVPFSPLDEAHLPAATCGVYLGGGFPELFGNELAANTSMLASLREAHARGLPLYAECGGLMLLGQALVDAEGRRHRMAGVIPAESTISGQQLTIGYREATAVQPSVLLDAGQTIRGHEFHWSRLETPVPLEHAAYTFEGRREGFVRGKTLASYVHVHFAANDGRLARRFIEAAAGVRERAHAR